jgi:hypothetical protein
MLLQRSGREWPALSNRAYHPHQASAERSDRASWNPKHDGFRLMARRDSHRTRIPLGKTFRFFRFDDGRAADFDLTYYRA